MITAHELARLLLNGLDFPVLLDLNGEEGLCKTISVAVADGWGEGSDGDLYVRLSC